MAGKGAQLVIDIVTAGVEGAVADMSKASGAIKDVGKASDDTSGRMSKVHEGIGATGDTAALATTGLRDLGGAMQGMGGTVGAMGTAMVTASTAFEAMDGAATLYAAAQNAASGAATIFNGVMKALKVTLLTNPIFLIAAVIIAIGAALVIAYTKSETFRNIVNGAFKAVLGAIRAVFNWVKSNWPILLTILTGPIGLAVALIIKNWDAIKNGAKSIVDWVQRNWAALKNLISQPFEDAWQILSDIFGKISSAVQTVVDWIGRIKFPSPPSWVSAILPGTVATAAPAVPGVARASAVRAGSSGGGVTINVSGALDPEGVARQIRRILAASDTRGGRTGVLRPVGTV